MPREDFPSSPFTDSAGQVYLLESLTETDVNAMLALEEKASDYPWTSQNFRDSLLSSHICVGAKRDGLLCAQAVFSIAADEAELLILAVLPSEQGKKIASGLLNEMEKYLSQYANSLFLEVRASNVAAIALYESLGFNQVGERPRYYPTKSGREDAFIFAKHIDN